MAKTPKERSKAFRARHKNEEAFKETNKANVRKWRMKNPEKYKEGCANRMRKYRERKQARAALLAIATATTSSENSPYNTKQNEGRAMMKVVRALPKLLSSR